MLNHYLKISPEVSEALTHGKPIVALESTIIAHGMPYPKNVETALTVENIVRKNGATPATIAIIDGKLCVGLSKKEIRHLGKLGRKVVKVSRRDIPFTLSKKITGATTVASTMIIASIAKISIFATGGIGGVHRGAESSMDVSADLQELANTDVAVVSAGAKAILDLKLTLEYLETFGIPVIGFKTDEFPAFYSRTSGLGVDYRIDKVEELAHTLFTKWNLGMKGGVLIANPILRKDEMKFNSINQAIEDAISIAEKKGIKGKKITPFLLEKIGKLTEGKSLEANIQLVYNNAKLATKIAIAFAKERKKYNF
ncbi:MAG: pseudouridine-5'-phosphate glycosidase [Saprospiraceae bacterium]|jgi:pseudouridine-5'-phosphate glycosidase|nr:pseudouridine-5'-phosphate glycosidase [Saprospiraceae bacterium]MDC3210092.1 pseudouridine-5'-phosphate glycosidase [Saprospiraceae bacterium]MDG1434519.1 pseudouridine-5'-phosphate glycosidase [Saprospiraceae bacterium]MDG2419218.1 pseudouridine-5'-phosphate glycosidase [Saprospiraceae bacterium]